MSAVRGVWCVVCECVDGPEVTRAVQRLRAREPWSLRTAHQCIMAVGATCAVNGAMAEAAEAACRVSTTTWDLRCPLLPT